MVARTIDEEETSSMEGASVMSSQKEAATATTTATTTTTNATSSKKITDPYQYVQKAYNEFQENSKLKRRADIPAITKADVTIQETLGTGGFADVKACTFQGRECALKTLKPAMLAAPAATFAIAAADLMKEAEFLAAIDHDNICSIYATHMSSVSNEALKNNFFVLERIDCTMDDRMDEWRVLDSKAITQQKPKARKHLLYDRLRVCLDIANTLKYLHDENVIYRDLKAANLGFDAEGNVKLFDFGLAKELKDDDKANGKYRLSGNTGSLAYMAPEVAKGWKYDRLVDVYSFAIVMWEICSLHPAFVSRRTEEDMHPVWNGDVRPPMAEWWPVELQWLLKKCWAYFAKSRPDFELICETLQEILDDEAEEEDSVRGIKSFRFGSRRSQKLSMDSHDSEKRRLTLRPRDLLPDQKQNKPHKKFFGLF